MGSSQLARRGAIAIAATALGAFAAWLGPASLANAAPGECQNVSFAGFGGGYCDQAAAGDGSFNHCETTTAFGISRQNCYQACLDESGHPFPTDMDVTTPC